MFELQTTVKPSGFWKRTLSRKEEGAIYYFNFFCFGVGCVGNGKMDIVTQSVQLFPNVHSQFGLSITLIRWGKEFNFEWLDRIWMELCGRWMYFRIVANVVDGKNVLAVVIVTVIVFHSSWHDLFKYTSRSGMVHV